MATQQMTGAQAAQQAAAQNMATRQFLLANSVPMLQQISSGTVLPDSSAIINIPPQNVGLIKGFLLEINANVTNSAGGTATLTPQGPGNILQNVLFTDLQNYQRINTPGWALSMLNTAKQKRPFLSSTPSDSPMGYGSNANVISAPATIAASATVSTIKMFYWIPLAYGAQDLTGAIFAGVVNATMNLSLTFANSAQFFKATGDAVSAVYSGSAGTVNNYTYTLYQSYLDQLPTTQNGVVLPQIDLNTIYELKNTNFGLPPVNQDFNLGYSNFRHFLSTILIFDNGGTFNAGTDINYFSFRTANFTDMRKADPFVWKGMERQAIGTDFPKGSYYFDTRDKPIYTTQQGNTNLVVNASTVNAGANVLAAYEMLANVNNLQGAGSLASNI
jgi:hypothetical protein